MDRDTAGSEGLQFVHEGNLCQQTQKPEPIGIVQASFPVHTIQLCR